jgi:uncharacterized alkaline shock family protein YloU
MNETSRTDLGVIKIHKNVIASIASLAATEIEGVKRVGTKGGILELLGKNSLAYIKVDISKHEEVSVWLPLIIKYGFNVPDVSARVQESVRQALEKMTNLSIGDININVQAIERGT